MGYLYGFITWEGVNINALAGKGHSLNICSSDGESKQCWTNQKIRKYCDDLLYSSVSNFVNSSFHKAFIYGCDPSLCCCWAVRLQCCPGSVEVEHCFCTSNTFLSCKMSELFVFTRAQKTVRQATSHLQWLVVASFLLLMSSHTRTDNIFFQYFMFYELKGQNNSKLGLRKMDTEYLGSRLYSSTPPQFVRGFTFSFPSLFAVGWQQQTPLYSSTFTTGFLVSQLGWYPGNAYNGGSSPNRCFLVTRYICSYGFYTVGVFLFVLYLSDSLALTTARSLLLQIYTISQMTAKALFSWAEMQFIVS